MDDPFDNPASTSGIDYNDLHGSLLIIAPTGTETGVKTTLGEKDAVRANITVLDGEQAGVVYNDTLVFPLVLQGQLKPKVGKLVIGRLGQGEAKPGQNPPWKLAEATAEEKALGAAWLSKQADSTFAPVADAAPAKSPGPVTKAAETVDDDAVAKLEKQLAALKAASA